MPDRRDVARDASRVNADRWSRAEIDAAMAKLAGATRSFSQSLGGEAPVSEGRAMPGLGEGVAGQADSETGSASADGDIGPGRPSREGNLEPEISAPEAAYGRRQDIFEERARAAEREAREYLERAKRRADSLVSTMIAAVETEAADIRRGAEEGIRERWRLAEAEAGRHVGNARRLADEMVAERQEMIGELSDGIRSRAQALTGGMDDADRIRSQFDLFLRALSRTAEVIAQAALERETSELTRLGARSTSGGRSAFAA